MLTICGTLTLDDPVTCHNKAIEMAASNDTHLKLYGLEEDNLPIYMSNYMGVKDDMVPGPLNKFVKEVTSGDTAVLGRFCLRFSVSALRYF